MKILPTLIMMGAAALLLTGVVHAGERTPAGYMAITEVEDAIKLAVEKNQLLVLQVKGNDNKSESLKLAIRKGERAIGGGVVKVFATAEALNTVGSNHLPEGLRERAAKKFPTSSHVNFLVFRPDMSKLLIEAPRYMLENEKDLERFKEAVAGYKKDLKE